MLDIRVSQIVESDDAQPVFLQKFRKIFRDVIRACPFPKLVNTDVIQIIGAVRFSTKTAKFFLLCLLFQKQLLENRHQRQRPQAGFCFRGVRSQLHLFSIHFHGRDGMVDGKRVIVEVNRTPTQPDALASSESVKGCQLHRELQFRSFHQIKEFVNLFLVIEGWSKCVLLGAVYLINRI